MNKHLERLQAEVRKLEEEARAILTKAEEESEGKLSDEQRALYDEKIEAAEKTLGDIRRVKRGTKLTDDLGSAPPDPKKPDEGDGGDGDLRVGRDRELDKPWENPGAFYRAIIRAGAEHVVDKRLLEHHGGAEVRATGMGEGGPPDAGGFLVGTQESGTILEKAHETGILPPLCDDYTVGAGKSGIAFPVLKEENRGDGYRPVRGYWTSEAAAMTASQPTIDKITLDLDTSITVLVYLTDWLLQDAPTLGTYVGRKAGEEIGFKLDEGIFEGTGAGQPLGIVNADCTVTVAKESGQANYTLQAENILNLWKVIWGRCRQKAVWLYNQELEDQLRTLHYKMGTASLPVFTPPGGLSGAQYSTIMGRPAVPFEHCKRPGTAGDVAVGDFSQYLLADKGGIQEASSIHVRFLYNETALRFTYRTTGEPSWPAKLTPKNRRSSSFYVSPFAILGARE